MSLITICCDWCIGFSQHGAVRMSHEQWRSFNLVGLHKLAYHFPDISV